MTYPFAPLSIPNLNHEHKQISNPTTNPNPRRPQHRLKPPIPHCHPTKPHPHDNHRPHHSPKYHPHSPEDYTITDSRNATLFTVTGKKYGKRFGHEFRDASGLPLFELYRVVDFVRPLRVRSPREDGKKDNLVEFSMSMHYGTFYMVVLRNAVSAAETSKREHEKKR